MQILIQVHYTLRGSQVLQRGMFPVHPRKYREDPEGAACEVAQKFIRDISMTHIDMILTKVLWEEEDITHLIK